MDVEMITTAKGHVLKAKMETGVPLEITRIIAGAGRTDDLYHLESLVDYKQELAISGKVQRGTQAIIFAVLSNKGLNSGYDLAQLAICANDPDEGEIIYKAAQMARAFPISAEKDFPNFAIDCTFNDTISNASEVIVVVDPAGAVTTAQFESIQQLAQEALETSQEALAQASSASTTPSVILSPDPPSGTGWTIWIQLEGEVPGYPEPDTPPEPITVEIDTAPLDAPGDFAVMYDDGSGETLLNFTDDPDDAGDEEVLIVEDE